MIILCVTGTRLVGYAEPNISKGRIPSDIPADLRKEIEGLYSPTPVDRVIAVYQIEKMAEKAVPAIPFLVAILGDSALLEFPPCVESTSPGKEAAAALIKIGKYSVKPLIVALNDTEPGVREKAVWALGEIKDPRAVKALIAALSDDDPIVRAHAASAMRKITGENFDEEPAKWQKWWNESRFRRGLWLTLVIQILRSSKSR
jgi:HEAT repeat protein